jgi:hypothetical protein
VIHILNVVFGIIPMLILAASIAAGVEDDRHHRRTFVLICGLWSITLAMWDWMRSAPVAWDILWLTCGLIALGFLIASRSSRRYPRKDSI